MSKPFSEPSNLSEQMQNLCWRLATEMRALFNTVGDKLSTADADDRYLAKTGKAVSATTADSATTATTATKADSATMAVQDGNGNVISSTYAKNSSLPTTMKGATSSTAGTSGTVPTPAAGTEGKFLRGDGTWQTPSVPTKTSELTNNSGYITSSALSSYVPLAGGTMTGALTVKSTITASGRISGSQLTAKNGVNTNLDLFDSNDSKGGGWILPSSSHTSGSWTEIWTKVNLSKVSQLTNDSGYLTSHQSLASCYKVSGGALNSGAVVSRVTSGQSWINGRNGALIKNTTAPGSSWGAITSSKSTSGSWETGVLGDNYYIVYASDTNYNAGTNSVTNGIVINNNGNVSVGGSSLTVGGSAVALKSQIPTKTSQLTNDSGFLTSSSGGAAAATAYVTASGGTSASWYRKWSDGVVECGGYVSTVVCADTSGESTAYYICPTITLPVAMSSANYLAVGRAYYSGAGYSSYTIGSKSTTTTSFTLKDSVGWAYRGETFNVRYYAIGR